MSEDPFLNPINPEKVAQNPGLLPYAHTAGSAIIKPALPYLSPVHETRPPHTCACVSLSTDLQMHEQSPIYMRHGHNDPINTSPTALKKGWLSKTALHMCALLAVL